MLYNNVNTVILEELL